MERAKSVPIQAENKLVVYLLNSYIMSVYRVYQKKVYSWKLFPKLTSGQNSRKLSVSLGSLASSVTSSTKFI